MGCSVRKSQVQSIEASARFLMNPSPQLTRNLTKCEISSVSDEETRFLLRLFSDLASRSTGETVDKGLWGERLFDKFDKKDTHQIDFDEFLNVLSICAKGSPEDKYRFLFSLYDLRDDGVIDKSELVTMVSSSQLHSTYEYVMLANPAMEGRKKETELKDGQRDGAQRTERNSSTASIQRNEFTLQKAEALAEQILSNMDSRSDGELDFHQFVQFLEQNPRILDMFAKAFHEELWSSDLVQEKYQSLKSPNNDGMRCCLTWCRKPITSVHVATQPETASPFRDHQKSGWILTKGKEGLSGQKMFVTLKNNLVLIYTAPSNPMPNSVIFLEGCYIDAVPEPVEGQGYGFVISHQFESFNQVTFWLQSQIERDEWVTKLKQIANIRKLEDYYIIQDRIGTGRYSKVYVAIEIETKLSWAIKVIDKTRLNSEEREMLRSEIAIMRLLNHPNVVQMKELFEDKNSLYLVVELVEGGELFARIAKKKVFSEYTAYHITKQLLHIVKYLHDVGIVHRDIKPENILLTDNSEIPTIKLADFGLSKLISPDDRLDMPCGTLAYVAPEILTQSGYNRQVDMWSVGVVTYLMLRGNLPFDSKDKRLLIQKTTEAKLDFSSPLWTKLTPYATDFLEKLLTKNVDQRLTCDQALSHAWIRNGNVLIPRKINKQTMEEDLMRKTITSAKLGGSLYMENPKSATLNPAEMADGRLIYTTPDIYEDMNVERRLAERHIDVNLRETSN